MSNYSGLDKFTYDGYAAPEFTVERPESARLVDLVKNGHRIFIDGPRRCGKTTLVLNAMPKAKIPVLRVNLEGIETREGLIDRVDDSARAFLDAHPHARNVITGSSKTTTEIGGGVLGALSMKAKTESGVEERPLARTLDRLLSAVVAVARHTKAIVFVDEFQAVKNRKIENPGEILGSFAAASDPAHREAGAGFVFAGSNRFAMHQIFAGTESLFYQRTQNLPVGPIPEAEIIPFLNKRFGGNIPASIGREAYRWTEGIPGDLQRLYGSLKNICGRDNPTEPDLGEAKMAVIDDIGRSFAHTLETLSVAQLQVLDGIASQNIRSTDVLDKQFGKDVTQDTMPGLLRMGLLHIPSRSKTIERPEPVLFHYIAAYPAVEHALPYLRQSLAGGSPGKGPDVV